MKETILRFELRTTIDKPSTLKTLADEIVRVDGVLSVDVLEDPSLNVKVQFEDPKSAKKLHRRLANIIMRTDGIMLSGTSISLTDIW